MDMMMRMKGMYMMSLQNISTHILLKMIMAETVRHAVPHYHNIIYVPSIAYVLSFNL